MTLSTVERSRFAAWVLARYRPALMQTTRPIREFKLRELVPGKVRLPLAIAVPLMSMMRKSRRR